MDQALFAYHKHKMSVEEMFMFIQYERLRVRERMQQREHGLTNK